MTRLKFCQFQIEVVSRTNCWLLGHYHDLAVHAELNAGNTQTRNSDGSDRAG
jgi:hypothetical protein